MQIRDLNPQSDLQAVHEFYRDAPDYWLMADGISPDLDKARAFFTDGPPNCDPAASYRLGLFGGDRLSGLAELSFGFPKSDDAYLGFMMLGPWARNAGLGSAFLAHVEELARLAGAPDLYLAVLDVNIPARRFWERHGFRPTGVTGSNGHGLSLSRMAKALNSRHCPDGD